MPSGYLLTLFPSEWREEIGNHLSKRLERPRAVLAGLVGRGFGGLVGHCGFFDARPAAFRHPPTTRPAPVLVLRAVRRALPDMRYDDFLGASDARRDFDLLSRECGRSDFGNDGDRRRPLVAGDGDPRMPLCMAARRKCFGMDRRRHCRRRVVAVGMPIDWASSLMTCRTGFQPVPVCRLTIRL
jgi:hypothetical protein